MRRLPLFTLALVAVLFGPVTSRSYQTPLANPPTYSLCLAWTPSTDPTACGYQIWWGSASQSYTNGINFPGATVTNGMVPSLLYGPTYYFAATCSNAAGEMSAFSNEVSFRQPNPPPGVPVSFTLK